MLPGDFSLVVNQKISDFLWRQWSQLGLAGGADWNTNWVIDPERLLLFSLEFARSDARLFDEIMDWLTLNERWISIQRMKALISKAEHDDINKTLVAVAKFMDSKTTNIRWKTLTHLHFDKPEKEQPFFYRSNFIAMPTLGETAKEFREVGWIRSTIQIRGLSSPVKCGLTSNLIFRLRSLCGLNPRAEIMTYLLTHDQVTVSELVNELRYAKPTIHEVINDLLKGGYVEQTAEMNRHLFSTDKIRWLQFMAITYETPIWLQWSAIYLALSNLGQFLHENEMGDHSEYIMQAKAIKLAAQMRDVLIGSGLPNPFTYTFDFENIGSEFPIRLYRWLDSLNTVTSPQSARK